MADGSRIEWTEATWNPIVGCSLESPGCKNCYAMPMARRIEAMQPGSHYAGTTKVVNGKPVWTGKVALAPEHILTQPLRWRRPRRIFVNSMGDLFHEDVPDEWIDRVFAVMALAPQHTFQVLTKRSARMRAYLVAWPMDSRQPDRITNLAHQIGWGVRGYEGSGGLTARPLPNVWLGVSTEDQRRADERVPDLLETPAAVRFVSAEPLLGPIDFEGIRRHNPTGKPWINALRGLVTRGDYLARSPGECSFNTSTRFPGELPTLDLVIVGGESGPNARPMHPDWVRYLRDRCTAAGVSFFFKQWGEWHTAAYLMTTGAPVFRQFATFDQWVSKASTWVNGGICLDSRGRQLRIGGDFMAARDEGTFPVTIMHKVGKKAAGRLLDGVEHNGMPEVRA